VRSSDQTTLGPTPVVRLLVTAGPAILAVPRADGSGLDIPTARAGANVDASVDQLRATLLAVSARPRLIGYVRNHVPTATDDYPWPVPYAYFAVWHTEAEPGAALGGQWLDATAAVQHLGQRHWWPLVGVRLRRTKGTTTSRDAPPGVASGHG